MLEFPWFYPPTPCFTDIYITNFKKVSKKQGISIQVYATLSSDEFNFAHKKAGTLSNLCYLKCYPLLFYLNSSASSSVRGLPNI